MYCFWEFHQMLTFELGQNAFLQKQEAASVLISHCLVDQNSLPTNSIVNFSR